MAILGSALRHESCALRCSEESRFLWRTIISVLEWRPGSPKYLKVASVKTYIDTPCHSMRGRRISEESAIQLSSSPSSGC